MTEVSIDRILASDQRARLGEFADVLIPGGHGLPSASEAKVHEKWIDRALAARPDLFEIVVTTISGQEGPAVTLDRLKTADKTAFDDFTFVIAGAYLMNPSVCKALGRPGNAPKPRPALPDESDHYLDGGILDPVIARGPIYKPTPGL